MDTITILTHFAAAVAGIGYTALRLRGDRTLRDTAVAIVPMLAPIWRPK